MQHWYVKDVWYSYMIMIQSTLCPSLPVPLMYTRKSPRVLLSFVSKSSSPPMNMTIQSSAFCGTALPALRASLCNDVTLAFVRSV